MSITFAQICTPLYGCLDNIIIMLPWQPSNMIVKVENCSINVPVIDLRTHIESTTMIAMATVNNLR